MTTSLDETLRLPSPPAAPPRAPFPLAAAVVPVFGAGVLWMVTGSAMALWFALLGPLVAAAGVLDGARARRRSARSWARESRAAHDAAEARIRAHHDEERRALWQQHPDVSMHRRLPGEEWRAVPSRSGVVVVGRGRGKSALRVEGGDDSSASSSLRRLAGELNGVPVLVPLEAGIAVVGPWACAAAVARGMVLQICLNAPPGSLGIVDGGDHGDWLDLLPHAAAAAGTSVSLSRPTTLHAAPSIPLVVIADGSPPPPRCAAVLTLDSPTRATLRFEARTQEVEVEGVSVSQAEVIAERLRIRAAAEAGSVENADPPTWRALVRETPVPTGSLPAVIGVRGGAPAVIDLVDDGPHAVVIGTTGSGKSELLTTWVASLAAAHPPERASFLLVDFKGGRTFDPLLGLPHVTGVVTDLDEAAALRAVQSLRAEVRRRERVLAEAGAREIGEARDRLGRLVVVVDEYAALVAAHPHLHDLFGDLAARGRALGIHLILASQRAAGVFRDSVLANAPLRMALRVTDASDSRAVLDSDDAVELSGRSDDRGICLVRRNRDDVASAARIVRCPPSDALALAMAGHTPPQPWLPPLPARVPLDTVDRAGLDIVLAIVDDPSSQRQPPLVWRSDMPGLAVVGSAGSGKSTTLRVVAAQAPHSLVVPADTEAGWDALALAEEAAPGTVVLLDDVDLLLARLPADYATAARERIERLVREARGRGLRVALSSQRATGSVGRLLEAASLRILLSPASRTDDIAAGGDGRDRGPLPPGRARVGEALAQVLWTPPSVSEPAGAATESAWRPGRRPVALVSAPGPRGAEVASIWEKGGSEVACVDTPGAVIGSGRVVWGTPESWLAHWRTLAQARADAVMVIDAACGGEFRALTGIRELPPVVTPHARRAWEVSAGVVSRVVLPG